MITDAILFFLVKLPTYLISFLPDIDENSLPVAIFDWLGYFSNNIGNMVYHLPFIGYFLAGLLFIWSVDVAFMFFALISRHLLNRG